MHPAALEQAAHPVVVRAAGGQDGADVGDHGLVPGLGVSDGLRVAFSQGDDAHRRGHPALALEPPRAAHQP
ncbi:hypothetical protein D3C87_1983010 [compost metagenome]